LEQYLKDYLRNPFTYTKDIEVNGRCPCGSRKKYKQCCKN
jgi:Predicted metal-binding protein related to the C-terminal domain of SecA